MLNDRHCTQQPKRCATLIDRNASRVQLVLSSVLSSVETCEETALRFAARAGFDPDTASNLAMVAREAAVNAVVHGNRYDPAKQIRASFEATSDELRITVADEGAGLDLQAVADPLAAENLMRPCGRGIFLMRTFMDSVDVRPLAQGTEITLVKRRTGPAYHPTSKDKGEKNGSEV